MSSHYVRPEDVLAQTLRALDKKSRAAARPVPAYLKVFQTKAQLLAWAPRNGTEAWVEEEQLKYVRVNGDWSLDGRLVSFTSGVSAEPGWAIDQIYGHRRQGFVSLRIGFQRLGGSINVNARGDIANQTVAIISDSSLRPFRTVGAYSSATGRVASGEFWAGGEVRFTAVGGSENISVNEQFSLEALYMV